LLFFCLKFCCLAKIFAKKCTQKTYIYIIYIYRGSIILAHPIFTHLLHITFSRALFLLICYLRVSHALYFYSSATYQFLARSIFTHPLLTSFSRALFLFIGYLRASRALYFPSSATYEFLARPIFTHPLLNS
jgi:predicted membrane protein